MKIGFWFDYDQTYTFVALFKAMQRRGLASEASGFLINDRYAVHAREGLPAGSRLVDLYDLIRQARTYVPTQAEREEFKALDERLHLARMAYSDRHLRTWTHEELVPLYILLVKAFRRYLDEARPDVFVFNCVASQYAHVMATVLKEAGVPMVIPMAFGVEGLIYLCDGPYQICEDIWGTYRAYKSGAERPDDATLAWADAFIGRVRTLKPAYSNWAVAVEQQKLHMPGPKATLRYLYNHMRYYRTDPTLPGIAQKIGGRLRARYNQRRNQAQFAPLAALGDHDFLYFPLHLEPEIATLIVTPLDQRSIIDLVAPQLPITWKLVIKEHPAMVGQRDPSYFRALAARYPNVLAIDPGVSSQLLASRARATLTLSGTVTLEAAILGTPAIFAHPSRFGGLDLGTLTQDFMNFAPVLDRAMQKRPSDEEIRLMLSSIRRHCHDFLFVEPLGHPTMLGEENIGRMADAIGGHIRQRLGQAQRGPAERAAIG